MPDKVPEGMTFTIGWEDGGCASVDILICSLGMTIKKVKSATETV